MFLGTPLDNNMDMINKGRLKPYFIHGNKPKNTSLSVETVSKIKSALINKEFKTKTAIAQHFSINISTLYNIIRGVAYQKVAPNLPQQLF